MPRVDLQRSTRCAIAVRRRRSCHLCPTHTHTVVSPRPHPPLRSPKESVMVAMQALVLLLLPAAAAAGRVSATGLTQLSIYNDWELMENTSYLDEWAPLFTFYRGHNLTWMKLAAAVPNSRMRGMYEMRPSNVFCPIGCTDCPSPYPYPKYGLCPHWEANVTAMAALLEPVWKSGALSSISLPDEVGCSGRVGFEQIDIATTAIRDSVAGWGPNPHGQKRLFIREYSCTELPSPLPVFSPRT